MINFFTYSSTKLGFLDKIVLKKRKEMLNIIYNNIDLKKITSVLDVGTTSDSSLESSNFLIKSFGGIKLKYSISDQEIKDNFFTKSILASITNGLTDKFYDLKSDLVICSATIEHLGNFLNIKTAIKNIINLSNKYFIITTPNRNHPIEFHTKLPFIHFFSKNLHRKILKFLGYEFFSKEENLNLLSRDDIENFMKDYSDISYDIKEIKLLGIVSNFIIIGKKLQADNL